MFYSQHQVGGSLAGLMHGIVFKRLGHNVHILERDSSALHSRGAGITAMESVVAFLDAYDVVKRPWSITSPNIQFLNRKAEIAKIWNIELQMTSWSALYYRLRANFDGLQSKYCPELPTIPSESEGTSASAVGKATYDQGKNVTDVKDTDGAITVVFASTGGGGSIQADLLIAADGPSSTVRQIVQSGSQRKYVGYVAWRGTVLEKVVSEATKKVFPGKLSYFRMSRSHILL